MSQSNCGLISFAMENCCLMCILHNTVYVLGRWQQHQEVIGAWHVVLFLTRKMKQNVMKNSIQVWFGKQPARQQHPSKRI
jgi:hypothetical protein